MLLQKQLSGNVLEDMKHKPKIVQFLNIGDFSSYTESSVPIDEPLFEPIPSIIQFTDYEPLQIKDKVFRLRNKDKYARRVKIIPPDSRLFQVLPYHKNKNNNDQKSSNKFLGSKVIVYTYSS
jgi:hydrocephalus-inducing protein